MPRGFQKLLMIGSLIACGQAAATTLLYAGRVTLQIATLPSDFLVFIVPAITALSSYALACWYSGLLGRRLATRALAAIIFSALAACLSTWLSFVIAFNAFGT